MPCSSTDADAAPAAESFLMQDAVRYEDAVGYEDAVDEIRS